MEEDPDSPKQKPPSMSEVFERLCPIYMSYGMSHQEYWYGDPWNMKAYKEAHMLRMREENYFSWLRGTYNYMAVQLAIANSFSKPGTPPKKYVEKPFEIFPKTEAEEKAEQEQKQRELIRKLSAWKKMFDQAQDKE